MLETLKKWLLKNGFSIRQYYDRIHSESSHISDIDKESFYTVVRTTIKLTFEQIDQLFSILDLKKDGMIDWDEWSQCLREEGKGVPANPFENLRMVVKKHNISADDLMYTMKLRVWDPPLNLT